MANLKHTLTVPDDPLPSHPARTPAPGEPQGMHARLRAMRLLLADNPKATTAEALAMLRRAFPDADLGDRVRALEDRTPK